jgi:hypothetical protein
MQILTFLKTPAKNTEQKIFKLVLVILPFIAGLTVYSFAVITAQKNEEAIEKIATRSGNANKRIAIFLDPIIRDIGYLQQIYKTEKGFDLEKPTNIREYLKIYSKFYLQNVRRIVLWDGAKAFVFHLDEINDIRLDETRNPPYRDFLDRVLKQADPEKIERQFGTFDPESKRSSILAATVLNVADSQNTYVVAVDIDSTNFFDGLQSYISDRLFLVSDSTEQFPQQFLLLDDSEPNIITTNDPVIMTAFSEWGKSPKEHTMAFRLMYDGKPWWVSIRRLEIKARRGRHYSGLIVVESELLGGWILKWRIFVLISSVSFGIVLIAAFFLWRRYHHDIKQAALAPVLNKMSDEKLLEVIAAGENDRLEFKSTLRWNLKSNKPDKAMEIACLKTIAAFLNTEGGTLLIGVEDDGNILGIKTDQFPNEDKFLLHFNNLVNQHLGSDNTEYFSFNIRHLHNKDVLIVDCQRADRPVFIKYQNNEDFYVRMGPGTRQLTTAESLDYVGNHF